MHARGACVVGGVRSGGHVWPGGVHGWGVRGCGGGLCGWGACVVCAPRIPRDTVGQCAGGTHPTGMHSCFALVFAFPWVIRKFYVIKTTRNSAQIVQLSLLFSDLVNRFGA